MRFVLVSYLHNVLGFQHDSQREPYRVDGEADVQRHREARPQETCHRLRTQQETNQAHR